MKLTEKKSTLKLLGKLKYLTQKNIFTYQVAAQYEKRLALKSIYKKLYYQKLQFLQAVDEQIELVKKEVSTILDPDLVLFNHQKVFKDHRTHLKTKCRSNFADLYRREMKNYKKYSKYLSKTNHAAVRAMIMEQRHEIKQNISEMNRTGLLKYAI
ncbi:hypothetical protein [Gramella sp. AN32]|uniref:Uncharacterized protein n=1 Tax=Christiangramia antarctica TaxID=2058158 RepID=A0ABW5X3D9_9FLAO|nr:hypothetical protein [Gramella sp. AN32]MCM4157751.1 hypothetical protein [Gramella sp. AN32]